MTHRDDVNFLLKEDPKDFDCYSALEAANLLRDAEDDLRYQLDDVPEHDFKGSDREAWRQKAAYKLIKVRSAARRFSARYSELREQTYSVVLKEIALSYLDGKCTKEALEKACKTLKT